MTFTYSQPPHVPGQSTSGVLDAFNRSPTNDGTLGKPDFSPVPYSYLPMLEATGSVPQWTLGVVQGSSAPAWGGVKGTPDGRGAARDVGQDGSVLLRVILQNTGTVLPPQWGRGLPPGSVWGPQDLAVAVRSDGTSTGYFLGFSRYSQTVRYYSVTGASVGPWDVEPSDAPGFSLSGKVNLWDGNPHDLIISQSGNTLLCLIDYRIAVAFPRPKVWHYVGGTPVDPSPVGAFDIPNLLATTYMGVDSRSTVTALASWTALVPPSSDCFFWHPVYGPLTAPNGSYYSLGLMDSNQFWATIGAPVASKDGVLLPSGASAYFTPFRTSGWLCTRFGSVAAAGGVIFRRKDSSNYLILTQAGTLQKVVAGTATTLYTLTGSIGTDTDVVIRFNATTVALAVGGVTVYGDMNALTSGVDITGVVPDGTDIGFVSPTGSSSQFRYVYFQPDFSTPILPTS